ncbi:Fc receptor-like protein 5 isoform X7 [Pan troglodytes]|uniref:Fc receptor-like protein 5 isoform X7 n=1 Tax=Pan troglodytes TaxID=9598 RepID=UPI003013DD45
MLLWVILLVLAPVSGQFARTPRPIIFLQPPWTTVFQGERVTLTCKGFRFYSPQKTKWYHRYLGKEILRETPDNTLEVQESGEYRCQAQGSPLSSPANLDFSSASLILQAPLSVFEGDSVVLRCRAKVEVTLNNTIYKNDNVLAFLNKRTDFRIPHARLKDNGAYHCTGYKESCCPVSSNRVKIQVQEPFTRPVLRASSFQPISGSPVTLTCETRLSLERSDVPLRFRFFRDDQTLGLGWSLSPKFQITAMWSKDSGFYWCKAATMTYSIISDSPRSWIQVQIPVSHPVLNLSSAEDLIFEGAKVTLHCEAQRGSLPILYQFHHEDAALERRSANSAGGVAISFSLTAEHSGNYYCTADNGFGPQRSKAVSLSVTVPVSRPILTLRVPRAQAVVGDLLELHCEAPRGSPPILYWFYHEDVTLGSSSAPSGGEASFNLSLTAEHSGNYSCEANNGLVAQHSDTISLSVIVPVSRPILTFRAPRAQAVVGDQLELHCEALRGSSPILYWFYHEDVTLGKISAPSGGGASFNLSLTTEHSGIYSCEADNGLEAQRSEMVTLKVAVPVSRPVLTLRAPGAHTAVGDLLELHCEALRGSPLILYRFFHEDVTLGNSSSPSGGASFNLSLTAEHSGNYSCEADNGLGAQRSETVTLYITGLTANRSGPFATGVAGGLLSIAGLAAGALLLYCWLSRKAGRKPASDPARSPSDSDSQEPTYHNVPAWEELQPVYTNANPRGENVVYSEVRIIQEKKKHAVASDPRHLRNKGSPIIYSEVKVASTPVSGSLFLASSAPHR